LNKAAVRVLLVYGFHPSGHSAAAFSLCDTFRRSGSDVSVVSIADHEHPILGALVAWVYHSLVHFIPASLAIAYLGPPAEQIFSFICDFYLYFLGRRRISSAVSRYHPDVIVCPQVSVAAVFARARQLGQLHVPLVGVITDFSAHDYWTRCDLDALFVPTEAVKSRLVLQGLKADKIHAIGIPVSVSFSVPRSKRQSRLLLGLPVEAPIVLVSGGGKGFGKLVEISREIMSSCTTAHILVLCGANNSALNSLSGSPEHGQRLHVYGPQSANRIAVLMSACDIHVGKPGGLTVAESLALGVPMIVSSALPGPERQNAQFLIQSGAAISVPAGEIANACHRLLSDRRRLQAMSDSASVLGRAYASAQIVQTIHHLLGGVDHAGKERQLSSV
jgi:processive 1,2-diacylglycerol beta-glucosyltransferase